MKISNIIIVMLSLLTCSCGTQETEAAVREDNGLETTDTTAHGVELLYMGQTSIRIVTESNKVIYIDPFAGDGYSRAADLILVTHEHYDHNAVSRVEHRQPNCRIIRSSDAIIDGKHQTFNLGYVQVEAVEAGFNPYHDVSRCVGYVLTFANQKKVYVSGDTSTTPQMASMSDMNIDYAFFCTDGVYNMGNEEAAEAAKMINARYNIPYHNSVSGEGKQFNMNKAKGFPAPNRLIIQPDSSIVIK